MTSIPAMLRGQVIARAKSCCEYCQTQMRLVLYMEVDHVVPASADGETTADNLCLACKLCNESKSAFQSGTDPETQDEASLFNPRTQVWADHFVWSEDATLIVGKTPVGRATIHRLKMNRPIVVEARRAWVSCIRQDFI
ncbi:MAG: HNH endonuclease signature motif containing protein [bacterium]|nr:HNH endonuclease signature motif containing protein [bacterium]